MINIKDISFSYNKKSVLSDLSLTLDKGELLSIIGVNGSGKTTVLRIISRMLTPESGSIEIDGKNSRLYSQKEYAQKISLLPQERHVPQMTVADYVANGRYPYLDFSGKLSRHDIEIIEGAIEMTSIGHLLPKKLTELSGGERQRVCFALMLAQDTPYILLDEPSTHLDVAASMDMSDLILKLRDSGKGIISVSHDLSAALRHSDKLLLLYDGKTAFYGTPKDAIDSRIIEKVFKVECIKFTQNGYTDYIFKKGMQEQ